MNSQPRIKAGVPAGGQYSQKERSDPEMSLTSEPLTSEFLYDTIRRSANRLKNERGVTGYIDTEDLVQEAAIRIFRHFNEINDIYVSSSGGRDFHRYINRSISNSFKDIAKKRNRTLDNEEPLDLSSSEHLLGIESSPEPERDPKIDRVLDLVDNLQSESETSIDVRNSPIKDRRRLFKAFSSVFNLPITSRFGKNFPQTKIKRMEFLLSSNISEVDECQASSSDGECSESLKHDQFVRYIKRLREENKIERQHEANSPLDPREQTFRGLVFAAFGELSREERQRILDVMVLYPTTARKIWEGSLYHASSD